MESINSNSINPKVTGLSSSSKKDTSRNPITTFKNINDSCVFAKANPGKDMFNGVIDIRKSKTNGFNIVVENNNGFKNGADQIVANASIPFDAFNLEIYDDKVIAVKSRQSPVVIPFNQKLDFEGTYYSNDEYYGASRPVVNTDD